MKRKYTLIMLMLCALCTCSAQKNENRNVRHANSARDSLVKVRLESLESEVIRLRMDSTKLESQLDSLQIELKTRDGMLKNDSTEISKLKAELEKQRAIAKENEAKTKTLTASVSALAASLDTMRCRELLNCGFINYYQLNLERILNSFEKINNGEIKSKYRDACQVLESYEKYNNAFLVILEEAQKDKDRNPRDIPQNAQNFADKYIQKIKAMPYYTRWYGQRLSISYLNEKIDKALRLLELHKEMKRKADFSEIIEDLKPKRN